MRAGRIELPPRAWQARVLPINYARLKNKYSLKIKNFLPSVGFEPTITASKAVVMSISLRGRKIIIRQISRKAKDVIQLLNEKFGRKNYFYHSKRNHRHCKNP